MKTTQRYYLSPIFGAGTPADPYHAKVAMYPVACATTIPMGSDGKPIDEVALCLVEGTDDDHASLFADRDMVACADHVDAMVKSIEFGKKIRESRRALAAMKIIPTAELKLIHERRAELIGD